FQAEDGIRDFHVTGVQTCALPIYDEAVTDPAAPVPHRAPAPAHRVFTWRNAVVGGLGAFVLLGIGAGGWMGMRVLGIGPAGTLADRKSGVEGKGVGRGGRRRGYTR